MANLFVASRLSKMGRNKDAGKSATPSPKPDAGPSKKSEAMANLFVATKMTRKGLFSRGSSSKASTPTPRSDTEEGETKAPETKANLLLASRMARKKSEVAKPPPEPDPDSEPSEGVGFVLTVPAPGPLDMSTLAAPPPSRGVGSAKSEKSIKSIKSVKSVEYGTQNYSAPKPDRSPRFPCCPMVTLPPFMHSTVRLCCPQSYKVGQHPANPMIGKFGIPQSPPYKEEKKPSGCQTKLVTCLTAIGCRDEKRDRWWWNVCIKKKKKGVAPVSVIGGPMTLTNKPSWAKGEEEDPDRGKGLSRFFKRVCCSCCTKEQDPEDGVKKQGCCGKCGSCCYGWFKKWFGPCYCGCCDKCLCRCCKKAADQAAETTAAAAAMDAVSKWGGGSDSKSDKKRGSMDRANELVASTPNQRNWRGILIALLVIVAVLGLIMFSIVLLSPPDEGPRVSGRKFSISDLTGDRFKLPRFNGTWVSDVELVFRDVHGGLTLFNAENLTTKVLIKNTTFRQLNAVDFSVSSDLQFVLLISDVRKVFRYSYEAKYTIYELATENQYALTPSGEGDVSVGAATPPGYAPNLEGEGDEEEEQPLLQLATWGPRGNGICFVHRNDLYYRPAARKSKTHRLTSTGTPGVIFNGVPDWLYEEEVLNSPRALWFSPDGRWIVYATFNDSQVGEMRFPFYGGGSNGVGAPRYPQIRSLRYPKAGTPNPVVTLWALDLSSLNLPEQYLNMVDLKPSIGVKDQSVWDHYFTAVTWITNRQVSVIWMNRRQNVSIISICKGPLWNCEDAHTLRAKGSSGWVDAVEAPIFIPPSDSDADEDPPPFVARLPVLDGNAGYFHHVVLVEYNPNGASGSRKTTPLTHGMYEVVKILAWDAERHWIYFIAAPERRPGQRHLYRVGDLNGTSPRVNECLTCGACDTRRVSNWTEDGIAQQHPAPPAVPQGPPPPCLFTSALFSPNARYFVHECLGPDPPIITLVDAGAIVMSGDSHSSSSDSTSGSSSSNSSQQPTNAYEARIAILDSHDRLREHLSAMALPQVKTFQVEVENGYHAQVRLHLPPGLREYEEMTFPLVLQVYGAPGSQLVSEQWGIDWGTYLASRRNFIYAQVDGRGSGFQGEKMLHEISRRLGSIEIVDQIAVITYLRDNLKFVDKQHIAVWGWSYGGFAAAMILAQDKSVFRCGISVAPVTSWTHYDSAYTERYMGLPNVTDNYRGYEEADMTKRAGNLREKMFLLIHGTADDNVHYQQSMMLIKALTEEGVLFRHHTYPDENHSFSGVKEHLYRSMEAFLDDCFGPLDFEEWEIGTSFFTFKQ